LASIGRELIVLGSETIGIIPIAPLAMEWLAVAKV
jgi:hypothetical protein